MHKPSLNRLPFGGSLDGVVANVLGSCHIGKRTIFGTKKKDLCSDPLVCELRQIVYFPKPWLSLLYDEDCDPSQGNSVIHAFYLCLLRLYYAPGSDAIGIMWYYRCKFLSKCWTYVGYSKKVLSPSLKPQSFKTDLSPGRNASPPLGMSQIWSICWLTSSLSPPHPHRPQNFSLRALETRIPH